MASEGFSVSEARLSLMVELYSETESLLTAATVSILRKMKSLRSDPMVEKLRLKVYCSKTMLTAREVDG